MPRRFSVKVNRHKIASLFSLLDSKIAEGCLSRHRTAQPVSAAGYRAASGTLAANGGLVLPMTVLSNELQAYLLKVAAGIAQESKFCD